MSTKSLSTLFAGVLAVLAVVTWPAALAALALVAGIATGAWLGRSRLRPKVG